MLPRILRRCDTEVDAAIFDLDDTLEPIRKSRMAVLSHRRGSDGRASIPHQVKKRLLDSVAEHAGNAGRRLPALLLAELAGADDADLVRATLVHRDGFTDQEKALALDTLVRRGRGNEAKELYPELWNEFPRAGRRAARRTGACDLWVGGLVGCELVRRVAVGGGLKGMMTGFAKGDGGFGVRGWGFGCWLVVGVCTVPWLRRASSAGGL